MFFLPSQRYYCEAWRQGNDPVGSRQRSHARAADFCDAAGSILHLQAEHDLFRARLRGGEARIVELRVDETDFSVGSVDKIVHPEIGGLAGRAAQVAIEFLVADERLNLPPGHLSRQEQGAAQQQGLARDLSADVVRDRAGERTRFAGAAVDRAAEIVLVVRAFQRRYKSAAQFLLDQRVQAPYLEIAFGRRGPGAVLLHLPGQTDGEDILGAVVGPAFVVGG